MTTRDEYLLGHEYYGKMLRLLAANFQVPPEEILGRSQKHLHVRPRHLFHKLLKDLGLSYKGIAELRNMHHTTIINSVNYADGYVVRPEEYSRYQLILQQMRLLELPEESVVPLPTSKAYIAGKITGLDESEVESKFKLAYNKVHGLHTETLNPYEYCKNLGLTGWSACMKALIPHVLESDVIYALPDYYNSRGALWELALANDIAEAKVVFLR